MDEGAEEQNKVGLTAAIDYLTTFIPWHASQMLGRQMAVDEILIGPRPSIARSTPTDRSRPTMKSAFAIYTLGRTALLKVGRGDGALEAAHGHCCSCQLQQINRDVCERAARSDLMVDAPLQATITDGQRALLQYTLKLCTPSPNTHRWKSATERVEACDNSSFNI